MPSKHDLRLDWASHDAALHACRKWHYTRSLPSGKLVKIGVWEREVYRGCVLFSRGANKSIGSPYRLTQTEVCELTRVALRSHAAPVSRIISVALRMLRRSNTGLRLVVSYADAAQGHHGGIYQAGGWIYTGLTDPGAVFTVHGKDMHPRSVGARGWGQSAAWLRDHVDPNASRRITPPKHRYLFPLDDEIRARIQPLARPYPKREKQAMT